MWSYPVLAYLSVRYPRLGGRLPTCYSPVRHFTHSPKGAFSYDLHVLSPPPAFVLSQDQTLRKIRIRSVVGRSPDSLFSVLLELTFHPFYITSCYLVFKDRLSSLRQPTYLSLIALSSFNSLCLYLFFRRSISCYKLPSLTTLLFPVKQEMLFLEIISRSICRCKTLTITRSAKPVKL
jgi:hypothetical protein